MIDEKLLLQEARRMIKNPKMCTQFTEQADEYWRRDLPRLEGECTLTTEHQLRERLKENGRSFDFISQSARQNWMAEAFLHEKLKSRIKVELPELLKYYNEHKSEREYDRPAEISWRDPGRVKRYPSREEARRKADSLHQALRTRHGLRQAGLRPERRTIPLARAGRPHADHAGLLWRDERQ